ncbi:60S ribosomal protein [Grosmannia clavigera kw1407]|uniref:60S ribosomal protein n=1 Tax=Grosmannia clavigera (strain kw1407 / UAMH 11150) TaxID=655863 RepID=F0XLQ3_GROCL|nr:60S ribosomal protein [Grosmannia clavigera kw1407]EFX01488.1 60S ribosomal protein [Grosmannia clavigera kw1407]
MASATAAAAAAATSAPRTRTCSLLVSSFPLSASSSTVSSSFFFLSSTIPAARRHQSTANRTKRALNIPPHASFLGKTPDASSASVIGTLGSSSATLIYNPPASAPSVYQTPFKFLPKTDPRRRANLMSLFSSSSSPASSTSSPTAPVVKPRQLSADQQKYHLTEADVAEMRRLRTTDPLEWSVVRLARHFNCSPIFVMLVVRSSADHRAQIKERVDAARDRWGPIRTKARAERLKRRELLYNGEL